MPTVTAPAPERDWPFIDAPRTRDGQMPRPIGPVKAAKVTDNDHLVAVALHLSPLAMFIGLGPLALIAPLVIWLVSKDRSAFNDDHGREIINFMLSFFLWHIVLAITVIGLILWPVLWVVALVSLIRAAVAGGRGEYFRYPISVRFL